MIFHKKETEKIELVTRPGVSDQQNLEQALPGDVHLENRGWKIRGDRKRAGFLRPPGDLFHIFNKRTIKFFDT